jgi:hypothetical protein
MYSRWYPSNSTRLTISGRMSGQTFRLASVNVVETDRVYVRDSVPAGCLISQGWLKMSWRVSRSAGLMTKRPVSRSHTSVLR